MTRSRRWLLSSAATVTLASGVAAAQETTTYTYDALGRLISSSISGGGNSGTTTGTCFDAAGNRTLFSTAVSGTAACYTPAPTPGPTPSPSPTPSPTPTPTPSNSPPVAVADTTSFNCGLLKTLNVTANDSDPENNVPLTVVSVTGTGNSWGSVISASSVELGASLPGTQTWTYVVADSLGAQSTGTITATVTGNSNTCQTPP